MLMATDENPQKIILKIAEHHIDMQTT